MTKVIEAAKATATATPGLLIIKAGGRESITILPQVQYKLPIFSYSHPHSIVVSGRCF